MALAITVSERTIMLRKTSILKLSGTLWPTTSLGIEGAWHAHISSLGGCIFPLRQIVVVIMIIRAIAGATKSAWH